MCTLSFSSSCPPSEKFLRPVSVSFSSTTRYPSPATLPAHTSMLSFAEVFFYGRISRLRPFTSTILFPSSTQPKPNIHCFSPSSFSTHKRMASLCLVLATPPFGSRKLFGFSEPSVSYYHVNHKIFLFNFIPTWTVGPDLTLGFPIGLRMDDLWTYPPPKAPCKSSESKLWEILLLREKLGFFSFITLMLCSLNMQCDINNRSEQMYTLRVG